MLLIEAGKKNATSITSHHTVSNVCISILINSVIALKLKRKMVVIDQINVCNSLYGNTKGTLGSGSLVSEIQLNNDIAQKAIFQI
jgi:hypothetical protein